MNAKLTEEDVFVLVTALLNKMDHPDTDTVRSEVEILINHLDSAPNLDPTEDAEFLLARQDLSLELNSIAAMLICNAVTRRLTRRC
jgi:hypothetical protein